MNTQDGQMERSHVMKYYCLLLFGCSLLVAGCQTTQPPEEPAPTPVAPVEQPAEVVEEPVFDFEGIPNRDYLVGGGYMISFRALESGNLYVAEKNTNKLLATVSLQPGEKFELEYDITDTNLVENLSAIGIDPKKATIKVYFVPQ